MWVIALAAANIGFISPASTEPIAGWAEWATVQHGGRALRIRAKLDTGARSSSINAVGYRTYFRAKDLWVAFELTNSAGNTVTIEAPRKRIARIRRAGTPDVDRPVIELRLCVAGKTAMVEFTLADRSGLIYPVLIGRSFLSNRLLVDSGRKFITADACGDAG